ncbi:MAG: HD domain-containing protein [Synergistetes bacterium]|nr:HD domain-containing protein [Synergistota bacterium]
MRIEDLRSFFRKNYWYLGLAGISTAHENLFLTGGALRDFFLGRPTKDIDIAFSPRSSNIPLRFASEIGGKLVVFGKGLISYRVIKHPFVFDFTPLKGDGIIIDLERRDFSLNSMALNIRTEEFFDPLNGLSDIASRLIKANSLSSLLEDRIRILRAFRFRSELGFKIDGFTKTLIKSIGRFSPWRFSAKERIAEEWKKLLCGGSFSKAIKDMAEVGYLGSLFFPFRYMEGMPQSSHHHLDVLGHTLLTVEAVEDILLNPPSWADKGYLDLNIGRHRIKHLIKLSALFHDIGKPFCFRRVNGEITFKGHQFIGARIATGIARSLLFNRKEIKFIWRLVYNHMMPLLFLKRRNVGKPWERSLINWLLRVERDAKGIFLLSIADLRATRGEKVSDEERVSLAEIAEISAHHLEHVMKVKPILSGREIMRISGLKPGPLVGTIKSRLLYLQKVGKIKNKGDALGLILRDNIKGCQR